MTVGAAVTGITFGLSQLTTESEFMATVSVPIYSSAGQNVFMAFFQNFFTWYHGVFQLRSLREDSV